MSKSIYTLVSDIYTLMENRNTPKTVDVDAEIERFGEAMKNLMKKEFKPQGQRDSRKLRLSAIGKKDKQQWYSARKYQGEKLQPHTYIKFMYGHMTEELILFLTRMAGHTVEDEQKLCEVEGVKGSMDARIDGRLIDVKSASTFAFKKFKDGTLAYDDPFGYVAQLKAYAYSEGDTKYGWVAIDKQNGHLAYLEYDEKDEQAPVYSLINYDIAERVRNVKKMVELPDPPSLCYEPVDDGKSGNKKLAIGCSYCSYKHHCYPNLRGFIYSTGVRYLVTVLNEPKVNEFQFKEC
tara:strand:+ start:771 stop:1646 length:876 start_codon:yes stop_codon:yes gene_type:complete